MDGMMKSKKVSKIVCLAVAMMFLFTSIASAAIPAGLYLGGSLNQYISMDYFWANDGENQTEIADLMNQAGLPNVVYVDGNEQYVNLADLAAGTGILQPITSENLDDVLPADGYADIENPENVIVPSLPPAVDTATAYVTIDKTFGFVNITVLSTTVDGVAKFQVAGNDNVQVLNDRLGILKGSKGAGMTSTEVTLLASDGTTVLASGTLTYPDANGNVTFNVTATVIAVDKAALEAAIADAQAKVDAAVIGDQPGNYLQATVDALEAAIADAIAVKDDVNADQATVDAAVTALNAAVTEFNSAMIPGADTATAYVTIDKTFGFVNITVLSTTVDGVAKFQVAGNDNVQVLNDRLGILKGSKGAGMTSTEVTLLANDGTTVLASGTLTYPAANGNVTFNVTATAIPVDKAALESAIADAQAKANAAVVGDQPGNYPQAAVDALAAAITDATAVKNNASATQAEVNAAVTAVNAAVTEFNGAKIPGADTATANVSVGAIPIVQITVTNTTVDGVVKFQVAGSPTVADLGGTVSKLSPNPTAEVTLLAGDGTTVLASGTLTWPNTPLTTTNGIVFDVE